jgi:glycerol kinase
MSDQVLAIDQGTHSTRAILFDDAGQIICNAQQAIGLKRLNHSAVEQSPDEILQSMQAVISRILEDPATRRGDIRCAGLATQRSSVLAWARDTGKPLSPVLSWQDRRTAAALDALGEHAATIRRLTGLRLSPHYGAGKMHWLMKNNPAVAAANHDRTLTLGPLASFLLRHLTATGTDLVDDANASRTLLWNLARRDWDNTLLDYFAIPAGVLPVCRPIRSAYGNIANEAIAVTAVNGDQTSALYSQGTPARDTLYINIGTGAFALLPVNDPDRRPETLLAGISDSEDSTCDYYVEGTVNSAAAALKWATARYALENVESSLSAWLDRITAPTLFINTLGGLGSPWWKDGPAAYFLDENVTGDEAMVAVVESILFLLQANLEHMVPLNPSLRRIQISGGLANLDAVCQRLANLTGLVVHRPVQLEATARGIAWLAAGCPDSWRPGGRGATFIPADDAALRARCAKFLEIIREI